MMIRKFLLPLFIALVVITFSSCSSSLVPAGMWPTYAERKAALTKHRNRWEQDVPVKRFGLARSAGIVDCGKTVTPMSIPQGMATLITRDGYALTANHAVNKECPGLIAAKYKNILIPVHMSTARLAISNADGRVKEQREMPGFFGYFAYIGKEPRKIDLAQVVISPVRVVKRFETLDLALVKTSLTPSRIFRFSELPVRNDTLFVSGNPSRYRASTAGEVIRMAAKDGEGVSVHTSVPVSPGDSGGPVFDGQGKLVGITTHGFPKGLLFFPASIARRIAPAKIETAIAEDRAEIEKDNKPQQANCDNAR